MSKMTVLRRDEFAYHEVNVFVRRWDDRVQAYVETPYASGLFVFKFLADLWLKKVAVQYMENIGYMKLGAIDD